MTQLIIDADSHITEPADVWTSRVPARYRDDVPNVVRDGPADLWVLNGERLSPVGVTAPAGWPTFPPEYPPTYADCHPGAYDAVARLRYMDEASIWAQVLYPNVGGFGSENFLKIDDEQLKLLCVSAYNDFLLEWASADRRRLLPIVATPYWDVDATVREIERCVTLGARGILFTGEPQRFGLPIIGDPHWDPLWEVARHTGLPIHFHIGSGGETLELSTPDRYAVNGMEGAQAYTAVALFMKNGVQCCDLITSPVLRRFPELQFVSVESGIGWLPFVLEAADYSWLGAFRPGRERAPGDVLPSDMFRQSVHVTYWFESVAPKHFIDQIPVDNVLFETDFPHTTCLFGNIQETIESGLGHVSETVRRKILWENAARLYTIEDPPDDLAGEGRSAVKKDDMILVSVDDHVIEPPDMFDGFIPAKYAAAAPQFISDAISDKWVFGEGEARNAGLNAVAGRVPEEYGLEPASLSEIRVGCYDVHERVKDMDANGVLGSLNFPSMARFCGQFFASRVDQDADLALAVLRAYNDWHLEAWCGAYPERFIPCTIPPIWDPQLMADEIRRTAAKGSHCVSFSMNPHALGLPSLHTEHWDPFWAACEETETVVTLHIGSGGLEVQTSPDAPMNVRITCSGINIYPTAADLIWSPVFQKFRGLKVALAEGSIGWIPYFLERADYTYEHHKAWTRPELGGRLPSEVFRDHIITCFIVDDFGLKNLADMNEDMVAWECDYPHSDTTWPNSPEAVWGSVSELTDEQIDKVTHRNAMRLFSFDPFSIVPREECTVGALRARAVDHDVTPVAYGVPEHRITTLGEFVAAAASANKS